MNKNISFLAIVLFVVGTYQYNLASSEQPTAAPVQRRSLREMLQEQWNEKLAKQEGHRKDSCKSILLGLAVLEDIEAFIKANNITEIFWKNKHTFAGVEVWVNTQHGSIVLDSDHLKELLQEAAVSYNPNSDFILFDTERFAIDSSQDILTANVVELLEKRRKTFQSSFQRMRCYDFEAQNDSK